MPRPHPSLLSHPTGCLLVGWSSSVFAAHTEHSHTPLIPQTSHTCGSPGYQHRPLPAWYSGLVPRTPTLQLVSLKDGEWLHMLSTHTCSVEDSDSTWAVSHGPASAATVEHLIHLVHAGHSSSLFLWHALLPPHSWRLNTPSGPSGHLLYSFPNLMSTWALLLYWVYVSRFGKWQGCRVACVMKGWGCPVPDTAGFSQVQLSQLTGCSWAPHPTWRGSCRKMCF